LRNREECLLRLSHHSTRQVVLVDRVPVGTAWPAWVNFGGYYGTDPKNYTSSIPRRNPRLGLAVTLSSRIILIEES
jgi:hypothetical protein